MRIDSPSQPEGSVFTNLTLANGTSFPSNPSVGELYFRTDNSTLYVNTDGTGAGWSAVSGGGGGGGSLATLSDVTLSGLATGQILYKSSGNWLNTGAVNVDPAGTIILQNNGAEKFRTVATGAVVTNGTFATPPTLNSTVPNLAVQGAVSQISADRYSVDAVGSVLALRKSRNSTIGSQTTVVSGDALGSIVFQGSDGTSFQPAAQISTVVDSTAGTNDMPGRLVFSTTADGSATALERFRINNVGRFSFTGGGLTWAAPATIDGGINPIFALQSQNSIIVADSYDTVGANPAKLGLRTSRGSTLGTPTISQANDPIGAVGFYGANGTGFDPAASIDAYIDGTPGASNDMPGRLIFSTTTDGTATLSERLRITNSGRMNYTSDGLTYGDPLAAAGAVPRVNFQGTGGKQLSLTRFGNDTAAVELILAKSRSTTLGTATAVQSGDTIGTIEFAGADGTQLVFASSISSIVDGTPGTDDMPGAILLSTSPDGTATPVERMRIRNAGHVNVSANGAAWVSPPVLNSIDPAFAIQSTTTVDLAMYRNSNDGGGPSMNFAKSRGTTIGALTAVSSGDTMGNIYFYGSDGTTMQRGAAIAAQVDGTPGTSDMPGRLVFYTTPDGSALITERMRINNAGQVIITEPGSTFATPNTISTVAPILSTMGTTAASSLASYRFSNDVNGPFLFLAKSRSATNGTNTVVQSGDTIGIIDFRGADGTGMIEAAAISCVVDGTPGTNDMPGRLSFLTTLDGAAAATERMRIANTGLVTMYDVPTAALKNVMKSNSTIGDLTFMAYVTSAGATNGTTLTAVSDLSVFTLVAGAVYTIEVFLSLSTSSTGGGKMDISMSTANQSAAWTIQETHATSTTQTVNAVSATSVGANTAGADTLNFNVRGAFKTNASTGPTVSVRYALNSSGGTVQTVVGSWIRMVRLA